MEENPEKAEAGKGEAGKEEEEMEESPAHSSSESENDSDGDGLAAFMWGRRYIRTPLRQGAITRRIDSIRTYIRTYIGAKLALHLFS